MGSSRDRLQPSSQAAGLPEYNSSSYMCCRGRRAAWIHHKAGDGTGDSDKLHWGTASRAAAQLRPQAAHSTGQTHSFTLATGSSLQHIAGRLVHISHRQGSSLLWPQPACSMWQNPSSFSVLPIAAAIIHTSKARLGPHPSSSMGHDRIVDISHRQQPR